MVQFVFCFQNGLTKQKGGIDNDDQSLSQQLDKLNITSESITEDGSSSLSTSIISNESSDSGMTSDVASTPAVVGPLPTELELSTNEENMEIGNKLNFFYDQIGYNIRL